jgi:hypothetical protein
MDMAVGREKTLSDTYRSPFLVHILQITFIGMMFSKQVLTVEVRV